MIVLLHFTLHEKYDNLGVSAGYALSNDVALITETMQSYDSYGRLNQVAVDGIEGAFTYGYLPGSDLQESLAMPNGLTRTFGYESNRDLLTLIVHSNATSRLVQRDFAYDGLGRLGNRTLFRANETPSDPDAFGYNVRSELTNAVIGTNAFAYAFDPIGNRTTASELSLSSVYSANALNQYSSISNFASAFTPGFDFDGNQTLLRTTTGIWHVWYNAENRPVLFSNDTAVIEMAYDYMGRRFEYKETASGTLTRHERYLYRGFLQIAALDMLDSASVVHTLVWDPSEPVATRPLTLQRGTNWWGYGFDQVKNVTELFDSSGSIAATYDYAPFGAVTASSGPAASLNPITFSSEVSDFTIGLQYYNFRHLNTLDGRWMSWDPIRQQGGLNIYNFVRNCPVFRWDMFGLLYAVKLEGEGTSCKPEEDKCKISKLTIAGKGDGKTSVNVAATVEASGCKSGEYWWWACIWPDFQRKKNEPTISDDFGDGSTYMVRMNVKYYYLKCKCSDKTKNEWKWTMVMYRSNTINWYWNKDGKKGWNEWSGSPGSPGDTLP